MHFYGRVCQVSERFRVLLKRVGSGMTRPKEEPPFLPPERGEAEGLSIMVPLSPQSASGQKCSFILARTVT